MNTIKFAGALSLSLLFVAGCASSTEEATPTPAVDQKGALSIANYGESTQCATEGGWCAFSGTRVVHYGTASNNVAGTFTDGVWCSNDVFGDPAYGIVKTCWVDGEAGGDYLGEWGPCDPPETTTNRYNEYSDVVPVYIAYAQWHCEGWTGKVFCEYESLSSVYGPGWGQCQCYNTVCRTMTLKRARSCRYRRCY